MNKTKKRLLHLGAVIILITLGIVGFSALTSSKPQLKKRKPAVSILTVRAMKIQTGPQPVIIQGQGTVRPLREIQLVSQVGGKVLDISPSLVNGGEFKKGDTLLRVDPVDYRLAVILAKSKVKDSESRLKLAKEESSVAREEWLEHYTTGGNTNKTPPPLVVKEPQLKAAQARLEADHANLKKAQLNLKRTELKAPFAGRFSGKKVDLGQYVVPGQALATLFSTQTVEIVLPLEDENLFWFHVPGFTPGEGQGSLATVSVNLAGRELLWAGKVVRAEGKLDERTRMINVIVRVENPYISKPPLAVGLFVTVNINGHTLKRAAVVPRSALHADNVIWVISSDGRLHFRNVDVARFSGDNVIIQAGLEDGEVVAISSMEAVTDGMNVRVIIENERNVS